jgi:hypothetical protein
MSFGDFIKDQVASHLNNRNDNNDDDFNPAASHAAQHNSHEDPSLFNTALSFLNERKSQYSDPNAYDVDENELVSSHQRLYSGGSSGGSHDSNSLGAGAAMQALKMFSSGESGSSGQDKNAFIGLAMAQAGKLWEQKNSEGSAVCISCFFVWGV